MKQRPVALIAAAGRGIGAACARELAERGYDLVLMSVSDVAISIADELGGLGVCGSVTAEADIRAFVERAMDRYGRIDAVVNNTGHPSTGSLLELSDDDWHGGLDLLLLNVVRMARLVSPEMERLGGGAIVNISTLGAEEPSLEFPISSALRGPLAGFTKLYADRYAKQGIRMNSVLPGFLDNYDVGAKTLDAIPLGRAGTLDEVAKTVAFLLSDDAKYITGQSLRVDGGLGRSL